MGGRKCEVKMDGLGCTSSWGADRGTRTPDPRITNALLYQLSHIGKTVGKGTTFFDSWEWM